jgi:hypothetical protein
MVPFGIPAPVALPASSKAFPLNSRLSCSMDILHYDCLGVFIKFFNGAVRSLEAVIANLADFHRSFVSAFPCGPCHDLRSFFQAVEPVLSSFQRCRRFYVWSKNSNELK